MSPRSATVDTLNKLAGKQKTSANEANKLALKASDISFPATRQSPRLKKFSRDPQKLSKRGRDFELPDEDDRADATLLAKKRKLNAKQSKTSKSSPLKQMGYDAVMLHPDESINLGDSPSQNTRSGRANHLKALLQKDARPSTRLSQVDGVVDESDDESEVVMNAEIDQNRSQEGNREAEAEEGVEEEEVVEEEEGEGEEEQAADGVEDSGEDVNEDEFEPVREVDTETRNEPPPSAQLSQEKKMSKPKATETSSVPNSKSRQKGLEASQKQQSRRGTENGGLDNDSNAAVGANGPERVMQTTPKSSQAMEREKRQKQQQLEQAKRSEGKHMARLQKRFLEKYLGGKAVNLEECSQYWAKLGGAVLWLQETYMDIPEQGWSDKGESLSKTLERLALAYTDLYKKRSSSRESNDRIEKEILSLEKACMSINSTHGQDNLVIDLYRFIIPRLVLNFRRFFKARLGDEAALNWSAMEELVRMLEIAKDYCEIAQEWTPRPANLIHGTRQKLRQDVLPSLRMILSPFKKRLREHSRAERDRREIDKLEKLQKARLRAFEEEKRARYETYHAYDSRRSTLDRRQDQRRIQRQSTEEDIPAPSGNWTDLENQALLNGLYHFPGENRYQLTLDCYEDVLERYDIDEIISQARYFREIMADSDPGDGSLNWLMSVR